eukprot:g1682.t1
MAPKKKKKGGKGKKGGGDVGDGARDDAANNLIEIGLLRRQLLDARGDAIQERVRKKELEAQVEDLKRDFEREEKATYAITADMTRQYKDMQSELKRRIVEAENTILELQDQLNMQKAAYEQLQKDKDRAVALKEAEIVEMKQKMDEMSAEFGDMLKETLEKMSERINITNSNFEADLSKEAVPVEEKLQEFSLK